MTRGLFNFFGIEYLLLISKIYSHLYDKLVLVTSGYFVYMIEIAVQKLMLKC